MLLLFMERQRSKIRRSASARVNPWDSSAYRHFHHVSRLTSSAVKLMTSGMLLPSLHAGVHAL